jgi:hypothetical protein
MKKAAFLKSVALIAGVAASLPLWADFPEFTPRVTDVTVFKDGHALIMSRASTQLQDGWCRTQEVPAAILGAFWTFVSEEDLGVDFVKAGLVETEETRPCMTFDEIIQANVGKQAVIVEQPPDAESISHEGILLGILEHESEQETELSKTLPAYRDAWGRYVNGQQVRETREEEASMLASFVMLRTSKGVQTIMRANVRSLCLLEENPVTDFTDSKKVREISIHVAEEGKRLDGEAEVGMVYIQKGIRWIPDYRIELLDDGMARISLQGTIINDLVDADNADFRLVVGVPSFIMKEDLSPMSLREVGLQLSTYFAPPRRGDPGNQYAYLSNAIMSQVAAPISSEGSPQLGGPAVPNEGQREDLFVYHVPGLTLKKGERAVVKLLEVVVPYEDIYTWDIAPVPPTEMWRHVNREQMSQLEKALSGAKCMHEIRLKNSGEIPWTTGPATIFRKGIPLGQQLLTYTSVKNSVDVPVTVATDVNTKTEQAEVRRTPNIVINSDPYTKVMLHGTLTVTNFKDRPIRLFVNREVLGSATQATAGGKIVAFATHDASPFFGDYFWYGWSWPWWCFGVNSFSTISWEVTVEQGKSATLEYDWHFFYR